MLFWGGSYTFLEILCVSFFTFSDVQIRYFLLGWGGGGVEGEKVEIFLVDLLGGGVFKKLWFHSHHPVSFFR